ncbi:epsin-1 isoform X2 [Eurytemora carolleeae]|uniref:epsin-1 isoform X2 n=1 Tax=Eurytemora carolleeae TaxID=1294199 RepID=UPI000C7636A3|nr:epsin-1 isoform X2 [Eurytemora carolleeae]|eukprot:XP_023337922.1 epsin-1-like isoform X2 [Eurytemora affinis]
MAEIADLTYNVIAFSEIMQMVWKRINDSGKNWRHVYKALVLLEYLIKTGSEKVAQQCKENLFSIQTLKDFQFIEENKDQGLNVREKAKSMVALLKDDERLKNERVRALKAKERFAQSTAGIGSDTAFMGDMHSPMDHHRDDIPRSEIELASHQLDDLRPQTSGEEELQLQLALAMSREEAETEESKKKSDDMRLVLAIQKSKEEADKVPGNEKKNALDDLVDLNFGNPAPPQRTAASRDPWSPQGGGANDPWGGASAAVPADPWGGGAPALDAPAALSVLDAPVSRGVNQDPWGAPAPAPQPQVLADPWGAPAPSVSPQPWGGPAPTASPQPWGGSNNTSPAKQDIFSQPGGNLELLTGVGFNGSQAHSPSKISQAGNPWDLAGLDPMGGGIDLLSTQQNGSGMYTGAKPKKGVESLLGEHSNLVNLDNLVKAKPAALARNPFAEQPNPFQAGEQPNPFQAAAAPRPTINQLRTGGQPQMNGGSGGWPESGQTDINPFF